MKKFAQVLTSYLMKIRYSVVITNMAKMKSKHEEICTSSDLISSQNKVLNANIKELESSFVVSQSKKDQMDVRCSAVIDENEVLSVKMAKSE